MAHINGNNRNNTLHGTAGDDVISGKGGDDFIFGHNGFDTLSGGAGHDVFVISDGDDHDTITDFNPAEDTIVLSYDAPLDPLFIGQAFDGMSFTTDAGHLIWIRAGDVNRDGITDTTLTIDGDQGVPLETLDERFFILGVAPEQLTGDNFLGG